MDSQCILSEVMDKSRWFWTIKMSHAHWHWWQKINHGNFKASLYFKIDKFYSNYWFKDYTWDSFVSVFWNNIHKNWNELILENQETRYAEKNKENVLNHLKSWLIQVLHLFECVEKKKIEELKNEKCINECEHIKLESGQIIEIDDCWIESNVVIWEK